MSATRLLGMNDRRNGGETTWLLVPDGKAASCLKVNVG